MSREVTFLWLSELVLLARFFLDSAPYLISRVQVEFSGLLFKGSCFVTVKWVCGTQKFKLKSYNLCGSWSESCHCSSLAETATREQSAADISVSWGLLSQWRILFSCFADNEVSHCLCISCDLLQTYIANAFRGEEPQIFCSDVWL